MGSKKVEETLGNGEEAEPEEVKMEKFYALLRSFHEARSKRRYELMKETETRMKSRRLNGEQSGWVPSFQWEDFTQEIEFRRPPVTFPAPCNIKHEKKPQERQQKEQDDDNNGIDLRLTL